jgi:hypothetical protein
MAHLFTLSVLLVLLPPFVLFGNPLYGTHSIAKIIWFGIFLVQIFFKKTQPWKGCFMNKTIILSLIFILSQLISYIFAINKLAFFYGFEDLFFGYIFFLLILNIDHKKYFKHIPGIVIFSLVFDILFNVLLIIYPNIFFNTFKYLFSLKYLEFIRQEYERNRLGSENFDFILLLPLLYFVIKSKKNEFFTYMIFLINGAVLLVSNFRTKSILFILSVITIFAMFRKKLSLFILFLIVLIGLVLIQFTAYKFQINFKKRFINNATNRASVEIRRQIWSKSLIVAKENPFGVGLGNFEYYMSVDNVSINSSRLYKSAIYYDPHNKLIKLLVETGIFGFISFLVMISYMAYKDFKNFFKFDGLKKVYFICFWSLVVFSMYNPSETIKYQILFWFFRAKL